jgi:hypothetical protein
MQTPAREPIQFTAGDTLTFLRSLSAFPASDGWSLLYELRGQAQPIEFASTASGEGHKILVDAATTALWLPGDYILAGYATNGNERHQIYYGDLQLAANLPAVSGDESEKTFSQKMVEMLEGLLLKSAQGGLLEARIGESLFKYQTLTEIRTEHAYWVSVRRNEIGRRRTFYPRFDITMSGGTLGYGVRIPLG